ncbi:MAG TPA: VOC family protein, partial [Candidatus Acidoferrales bacterium]|nr:VOC family protein [Candidatus Acidoferrales bacterium]
SLSYKEITMEVNPYLNFNGNCEEAFRFYEKHLGGKIESIHTFAGSPMENQLPPEARNKVMHMRMTVGKTVLMGSDAPGGRYQSPQGFSVSLNLTDAAEAEKVYAALSANGKVLMEIQQTFWAKRFAMFTDQFGIPWMINCE